MCKNNWSETLYKALMSMDPSEFIGIVRLLQIDLVTYEGDKPIPRDSEELLLDVFNKVEEMNRPRRRNFMKLVNKATK